MFYNSKPKRTVIKVIFLTPTCKRNACQTHYKKLSLSRCIVAYTIT